MSTNLYGSSNYYCKETAQNSCEITTTAESPLSSLDPANDCIANLYALRASIKHRNSIHTNDPIVHDIANKATLNELQSARGMCSIELALVD